VITVKRHTTPERTKRRDGFSAGSEKRASK
jgi:hypothetical protein